MLAVLLWSGRATAGVPPTEPVDPAAPVDTGVPVETVTPATTLPPGVLPPALGPLVVVPPGCLAPAPAQAVFVGQLANTDQPPTTARFRVESVLAGNLDGYTGGGNLVDVRYGEGTRFLELGAQYVVGAAVDAETGVLVSTVREATPLFGGDAVIGANDSDIDCPRVEDPVRTLRADGTPVDTGVFTPLKGGGSSMMSAVLRPLAVALGVLVALVLVKHLLFGIGRSLRDMGTGEPPPRTRGKRRHIVTAGQVSDSPVELSEAADPAAPEGQVASSVGAHQPGA